MAHGESSTNNSRLNIGTTSGHCLLSITEDFLQQVRGRSRSKKRIFGRRRFRQPSACSNSHCRPQNPLQLPTPTHHGQSPVGVLVSAVLFGWHVCDLRWGRRFWTGPFHLISGNPNKWMLERNEVEYLGYIVSLEGIRPPSHKLKKEDFPRQVVAAELNCRNAYFLSPLHSEYFWHIRSAKWASQDSTRQR